MVQAQQKWSIEPAPNTGGYPGAPYFKIAIAGTERVLAATSDAELTVLPAFTGAPEQLWRLDQLGDGTYRLMPKAVPGADRGAGVVGDRQQHADAGQIPARQRPAALGDQGAVGAGRKRHS